MTRSIQEQMDLFAYGGLHDQGGSVDPVSGNPVPVGATQREVRDDVPAQLSHGEFVFPADVTRYYGLDTLMEMRGRAKQGLRKMEEMGQMGGQPVEAAEGQAVNTDPSAALEPPQVNPPQVTPPTPAVPGVSKTIPAGVTQGTTGGRVKSQFAGGTKSPTIGQGATSASVTKPVVDYSKPTSAAARTPSFRQMMGTPFGNFQKTIVKKYNNPETGEFLYIPFVGGKPIYPIPSGYILEAEVEQKKEAAKTPTQVRPKKPLVSSEDSDEDPDPGHDWSANLQTALEMMNTATGGTLSLDALKGGLGYPGLEVGLGNLLGFVTKGLGKIGAAIVGKAIPGTNVGKTDPDKTVQEAVDNFNKSQHGITLQSVLGINGLTGRVGTDPGDFNQMGHVNTNFGYGIDLATNKYGSGNTIGVSLSHSFGDWSGLADRGVAPHHMVHMMNNLTDDVGKNRDLAMTLLEDTFGKAGTGGTTGGANKGGGSDVDFSFTGGTGVPGVDIGTVTLGDLATLGVLNADTQGGTRGKTIADPKASFTMTQEEIDAAKETSKANAKQVDKAWNDWNNKDRDEKARDWAAEVDARNKRDAHDERQNKGVTRDPTVKTTTPANTTTKTSNTIPGNFGATSTTGTGLGADVTGKDVEYNTQEFSRSADVWGDWFDDQGWGGKGGYNPNTGTFQADYQDLTGWSGGGDYNVEDESKEVMADDAGDIDPGHTDDNTDSGGGSAGDASDGTSGQGAGAEADQDTEMGDDL